MSTWKSKWQVLRHNPTFLLVCLCLAAVIQGMIFTNVVISTIEKRFGWDSTQSGIIAGSYDIGSFLSVIPVTYFGGRPGASKPRFISGGLFLMGTGSLIFASPHFLTPKYSDSLSLQNHRRSNSSLNDDENTLNAANICSLKPPTVAAAVAATASDDDPEACQSGKGSEEDLQNYKYVFILGQIFHGIGAAALITLGTTLLDETVSESRAPIFISIFEASFVFGPAFGYVIGGRLLNIFTEFYAEAGEEITRDLSVDDPKWIGAWWLGFLLIFILSYMIATLIWLFPARVKATESKDETMTMEQQQTTPPEKSQDDNENVLSPGGKLHYGGSLSELPNAIFALLANMPFMGITMGATMDGFLLAGQAAFLPKYLESQYNIAASQAAFIVGSVVVPAGALGTLIGGFSLNKFNLNRDGAIKLYIVCQFIVLPLYFGFLFNCPTADISGVNYFNATCQRGCECKAALDQALVCSQDDNLSFLSGCHAGCTLTLEGGAFGNCSCLPSHQSVITPGACQGSTPCNHIYLAVILFFQVLFTFMGTMPGLVAGLRSVHPEEKSIALGLQTLIARSLGTVPGPIFFGYIIDQTCLLWNQSSCSTLPGSCKVYDNVTMSHYVLITLLTWRILATLAFGGAFYAATRQKSDLAAEDTAHDKE